MTKELELQLVEAYPKIFQEYGGDKHETCMAWGMACGDGWFTLIHVLCSYLQHQTDINGSPQVIAQQVKEKFGTLRFYIHGGDERQKGAVHVVELLSSTICEQCGTNQDVMCYKEYWWRTLCPACNKLYLSKRRS